MPIADRLYTATPERRLPTDILDVESGNLIIIQYAVENLMLRIKVQIETT